LQEHIDLCAPQQEQSALAHGKQIQWIQEKSLACLCLQTAFLSLLFFFMALMVCERRHAARFTEKQAQLLQLQKTYLA
jgi:hypothetical protein